MARRKVEEHDAPEVVNELEPQSEDFVRRMLELQGTEVTDSLLKELGSRVADVIRSVK